MEPPDGEGKEGGIEEGRKKMRWKEEANDMWIPPSNLASQPWHLLSIVHLLYDIIYNTLNLYLHPSLYVLEIGYDS